MASDALRAADRELIGDIWTSDGAWAHCEALVDRFPRRYAGHPEEAGARDYLLAALGEVTAWLSECNLEPRTQGRMPV